MADKKATENAAGFFSEPGFVTIGDPYKPINPTSVQRFVY